MSNAKTALIVDDSKLSRVMIKTILKEHYPDWEILEAEDGDAALKLADKAIDVMTLDMNMPGMNGIELGQKLKQRFPDALIALVTANIQQSTRDKAKNEGFVFVPKPVTEEKILNVTKQLNAVPGSVNTGSVFNADELDAITEYFNIGVGQSACSLSEMIEKEVTISVPRVNFKSYREAFHDMGMDENETVVCVTEKCEGIFKGRALMLMPEASADKLIAFFNQKQHVIDDRKDTLCEIGNVLINACVSTIADLFHGELETGITWFTRDKVKQLIEKSRVSAASDVLLIEMMFSLESEEIQGQFRLLIDLNNISELKEKINENLG